jgi:hypothetical protein
LLKTGPPAAYPPTGLLPGISFWIVLLFIVPGLNRFGRGFWRIRVRYRMDGRLPRRRSAPVETRLRVLRLTGMLLIQRLPVRDLLVAGTWIEWLLIGLLLMGLLRICLL